MSGSVTDHDCVGELTVDHMFECMKVLLRMIEYPTLVSTKSLSLKLFPLKRCTFVGSQCIKEMRIVHLVGFPNSHLLLLVVLCVQIQLVSFEQAMPMFGGVADNIT